MRFRHARCVLLLVPTLAVALDADAKPPDYLALNYRAEWRMKPLREVLLELQKTIEKPVVASESVLNLGEHRVVALVDERKSPLRDTLQRLEAIQDLRFTAEPLRLRVESVADVAARRRRPVDLELSEYGVFSPVRDFPAGQIGLRFVGAGSTLGGNTFASGGGGGTEAGITDVGDIVTWLSAIVDTGQMETHGRMAVQVMATPEEEAALRKALDGMLGASMRQTSWRVTWGVAQPGTGFPTGVVPSAEAARVAQELGRATRTVLLAQANQRVHGGRLQERTYLADGEIVSSRLDPVVAVLDSGVQADLRALPGATLTLLSYRLDWVEPGPTASAAVAEGPGPAPEPAKDQPPAPPAPGEQLGLQLPAVWTWQPAGDVVLPHGYAAILVAEHPDGRAVAVIEEVR